MNKKSAESNKQNLFVYGLYSKIITNEKNYTILQAKNKKLAAYWLLVIFAGIGGLFSTEETGLPFDQLYLTIFICIIGITGITYMWYEDLIIQERLLNLNHLDAFRLENLHKWLPKVHHQHVCYSHKTMLKLKVLFYVGCNAILYTIICLSFVLFIIKNSIFWPITTLIISLIIFVFLLKIMFVKSYKNELTELKEFANDRR